MVRDSAHPSQIADSRARSQRCHLSEKALVDAAVASPSWSSYSALFDDPVGDFDFPVNRRATMDADAQPLKTKTRTLAARVTMDASSSWMFISHGFRFKEDKGSTLGSWKRSTLVSWRKRGHRQMKRPGLSRGFVDRTQHLEETGASDRSGQRGSCSTCCQCQGAAESDPIACMNSSD